MIKSYCLLLKEHGVIAPIQEPQFKIADIVSRPALSNIHLTEFDSIIV